MDGSHLPNGGRSSGRLMANRDEFHVGSGRRMGSTMKDVVHALE